MGENYSLTDIATVANGGMNGNGSWLWIILFLAIFNGGFGNRGTVATTEDLNFSRLETQVRDNANLTERKADAIVNGLSSLGYEVAQQFGNTNTQMATGFCGTSKEILESRYLNAQAVSASNADLSEKIGALASKIDQNKIESLQAQVNDLKMQNMFCGVPRINPYAYGVYPYATQCGCNCGNTNI